MDFYPLPPSTERNYRMYGNIPVAETVNRPIPIQANNKEAFLFFGKHISAVLCEIRSDSESNVYYVDGSFGEMNYTLFSPDDRVFSLRRRDTVKISGVNSRASFGVELSHLTVEFLIKSRKEWVSYDMLMTLEGDKYDASFTSSESNITFERARIIAHYNNPDKYQNCVVTKKKIMRPNLCMVRNKIFIYDLINSLKHLSFDIPEPVFHTRHELIQAPSANDIRTFGVQIFYRRKNISTNVRNEFPNVMSRRYHKIESTTKEGFGNTNIRPIKQRKSIGKSILISDMYDWFFDVAMNVKDYDSGLPLHLAHPDNFHEHSPIPRDSRRLRSYSHFAELHGDGGITTFYFPLLAKTYFSNGRKKYYSRGIEFLLQVKINYSGLQPFLSGYNIVDWKGKTI